MTRLVVIAGPTGTGKSALAVRLAQELPGEVVNADSMQLYRGMDIGTAKLRGDERHGIPHHLLDVLDVRQAASVAAYQRHARAVVGEILGRGHYPILVGGSGLYIQSVIDEIDFPGTDPALRADLTTQAQEQGVAAMYARLERLDPVAADLIGPSDIRRIIRALEVVTLTGKPFRAALPAAGPPRYGAVMLGLDTASPELDERLARRVADMMAAGFLNEVAALATRGLREGRTASRALGYAQLLAVLDGRGVLPDAVADIVAATRRFVRRQRSWFRRDARWQWLDPAGAGIGADALALARSVA